MNWRVIALVGVAVAAILIILSLTGGSVAAVASELYRGAFGSPRSMTGTLKEITPLLIMGLGVFIALRAGLFNIGMEGQFLAGALVAALVPLRVPGLGGAVLAVLAGTLAGMLYAFPAAWIRVKRGGHEVITTIMLNLIAFNITEGLAAGRFKGAEYEDARTQALAESSKFVPLVHSGPFKIFPAILVGILLVVAFWYWYRGSVKGYELRAVGAGKIAAECAGINANAVMIRAFMVSGALGGFAGAMQVLNHEGQFYSGMSPGYGFNALGVALLAGGNPLGLLPSALAFGFLEQGQTGLAGSPKGLPSVLLGIIIIIFAAIRYRDAKRSEA